jgi:hypothetical protein
VGDIPDFHCTYLTDYLKMVEDTESPRLFHIWSAISAIGASLGRRCYLPFGPMVIYPNIYALLVGNPGTRKSTASSFMKRILKDTTGVRFAPQDTSGQRQGLVSAMQSKTAAAEFLNGVELNGRDNSLLGLTLSEVEEISTSDEAISVAEADKHHLMIVASEFSRFIGQNNISMLEFLTTMWDGDDYEYQLKSSLTELRNPLLNMLGCTTPTSIALSMPPAAGGQGFLSRVILVYGARKYKSVPRPSAPNLDLVQRVKETIGGVYYERHGAFDETQEARAYSEGLYDYNLEITDSRFGYYNERRYTHLIKLAMCLSAARGSSLIVKDDYHEAHRILRATERGMPDALGEFGMNPLAQLKQSILENLRTNGVVAMNMLQAQFHRDAGSRDITEVVNDLHRVNQVQIRQGKDGAMSVHAVYNQDDTEGSMMNLLAEK